MALSRTLAVMAASAILALAGCGSSGSNASSGSASPSASSTSPAQSVCTAKDDLSTSLSTVVSEVKAGDYTAARGHLPGVTANAEALRSAIHDLTAQEQQNLKPLTQKLEAAVGHLKEAGNLREVRTAMTMVVSDVSDLLTQVSADLQCPSASPS